MQKIIGKIRKATQDYAMIESGDNIAVGVSGGKDSLALLMGLARLKTFSDIPFNLTAISLDPRFFKKPCDFAGIQAFCDKLSVPYKVIDTDIYEIVFEVRREKNPCALCANLRRGALHKAAKANGCNKVALGHNREDVTETFIMNLFNEGRIGCFKPVTYLDRMDITVIRPLIYCGEKEIISCAQRYNFPIIKSPCPADKHTNREKTKQFINQMNKEDKGFSQKIFTAIKNGLYNY